MVEIEVGGPDYAKMAMEALFLTEEEKELVRNYVSAIFLATDVAIDYPEIGDVKAFADKKYPGAWPLVEKVLIKANELEIKQFVT